ncbi:GIY-YIG nuclease family protein (plasmid) [Rossellomorea sp. AcN35-11]|nr:GIY-YIG nuclease family protein [Rossellomorea aquimaris]WJV32067.1 GIY-YIG nuclease family protein [Rossellomorea sp. AcN35-11]
MLKQDMEKIIVDVGNMGHRLLDRGIYAVINKSLGLVYVGETQRNFLLRWVEHLDRLENYFENEGKTKLFLHEHTQFIVLKEMNSLEYSKSDFYNFEYEAYEFYKSKGWGIASRHYKYGHDTVPKEIKGIEGLMLDRYRQLILKMSLVLATKNTNHTNNSVILNRLYRQLERKFGTDIKKKNKSILSGLNKEELEFIVLDLYPRYYNKQLALVREEYKNSDHQLNLF